MSWETTYYAWRSSVNWTYVIDMILGNTSPSFDSDFPEYQWTNGASFTRYYNALSGLSLPPVMVYSMKNESQVAFKDLYDSASPVWIATRGANNPPNWDGPVEDSMTNSCGNAAIYLIGSPEITRSQTSRVKVYISNERELVPQISAYVTVSHELPDGITATIQQITELPLTIQAAILGPANKAVGIRAAIRDQPELAPGITASAAKTDELADGLTATVQADVQLNPWIRTAILGETQLEVSIATFIVVSRKDTIRLEMENLGPQEFAHRTVPNWASRVKDYRTDSLGS